MEYCENFVTPEENNSWFHIGFYLCRGFTAQWFLSGGISCSAIEKMVVPDWPGFTFVFYFCETLGRPNRFIYGYTFYRRVSSSKARKYIKWDGCAIATAEERKYTR